MAGCLVGANDGEYDGENGGEYDGTAKFGGCAYEFIGVNDCSVYADGCCTWILYAGDGDAEYVECKYGCFGKKLLNGFTNEL